MKIKLSLLVIIFLVYTAIVCFCPEVKQLDYTIILQVQNILKSLSLKIPVFIGNEGYMIGTFIPIVIGGLYFIKKHYWKDLLLFSATPFAAYLFNCTLKNLIHRSRPPFELQIAVHKTSFSYPSNHAFITCCFWGLIIYYLIKYCRNKTIKIAGIAVSVLWILVSGFCRVWIGVHHPTDIIAGYFLAGILLYMFISIDKKSGQKISE